MIKFSQTIHIDDCSGNEIISLKYVGELPFPPTVGLKVQLSGFVSFEIQGGITYSIPEKMYQTASIIKYDELDHEPGLNSLYVFIARYMKNGFDIWDTKELSEESVNKIQQIYKSKGIIA